MSITPKEYAASMAGITENGAHILWGYHADTLEIGAVQAYALQSIAISLKRIADTLDGRAAEARRQEKAA